MGKRLGGTKPPLLFSLLLITLAVMAVLTYEAVDAARSHQATATSVLQDYASLAAGEFVRRGGSYLGYYGIRAAMQPLARKEYQGRLPRPSLARPTYGDQPNLVHSFFRLDPNSDSVSDSIQVLGGDDASFFTDDVLHRLRGHSQQYESAWEYALIPPWDDRSPPLVYRRTPEGRLEGFIMRREALLEHLQRALLTAPLLPAALGQSVVDNSLLSVSVTSPSGLLLYSSSPSYSALGITVEEAFQDGLRDLKVIVSLRPEAASQLIIGGLPRSRVPVLVGLLILTTGLIFVALHQLRREREFSRRQSDFIAAISHELRTPLAQIQMFSDTLRLGRVRSREEEQRSLEIISQESQRLANLVENVIQFSRASRQQIKVSPRPTALVPLLKEVSERFQPLALSSGARLELEVSRKGRPSNRLEDFQAEVDPDALRRILLNLLDNACKYGRTGQTVTIGLQATGSGVRIWVEDQGEGIAPAERERIWERFERLPRHRNAAVAGAGIGLSVVRELTESQRGRVWVEEGSQGGARFVLEFASTGNDSNTPQGLGGAREAAEVSS